MDNGCCNSGKKAKENKVIEEREIERVHNMHEEWQVKRNKEKNIESEQRNRERESEKREREKKKKRVLDRLLQAATALVILLLLDPIIQQRTERCRKSSPRLALIFHISIISRLCVHTSLTEAETPTDPFYRDPFIRH